MITNTTLTIVVLYTVIRLSKESTLNKVLNRYGCFCRCPCRELRRSPPVYLIVIDDDRDAECTSAEVAAPEQQPVLQPLPVHHVQATHSAQASLAGLYSTAGASTLGITSEAL